MAEHVRLILDGDKVVGVIPAKKTETKGPPAPPPPTGKREDFIGLPPFLPGYQHLYPKK